MKCGTAALTEALPHHGTVVEGGATLPHNLGQRRIVFEEWLTWCSLWRWIGIEIEHLVAHNGQRF